MQPVLKQNLQPLSWAYVVCMWPRDDSWTLRQCGMKNQRDITTNRTMRRNRATGKSWIKRHPLPIGIRSKSTEQTIMGRRIRVRLWQSAEKRLWACGSNVPQMERNLTKIYSKHLVIDIFTHASNRTSWAYSYQQPVQNIYTQATTTLEPTYGAVFPFFTELDPVE